MKYLIFGLLYVLASLFLPIESWARKTRSDKGGHHHHSAEYYAKKALTQDDTSETPSDSLAGSNAVANGSNAQVGDSELIANEALIFSIFTILSVSTFIIGRVVSKRRNLLQIKQNEEENFQWFSKVEQLKQNARISKDQNIDEFKVKVRNQIESLFQEESITESERNQVIQHLDGVNLSLMKETYLKVVTNANNRIKWLELYDSLDVERMISGQYWHGMSEDQLLAMRGEPTKIESEMLKTKVNKFYIYGTKSAGDVFVFNEGKLERFKDR
ncbi:MAG: hypothetical protein RLY35_1290 [Bacteroidota bacterium]|jgi:hypothetical protein